MNELSMKFQNEKHHDFVKLKIFAAEIMFNCAYFWSTAKN